MSYLNRKLIRDLRTNWRQFFSVFLMAFLSVLVFVGLQGAWRGLAVSLDSYIRESKLANHWVQATTINAQQLKQIKRIAGIEKVGTSTRLQVKSQGHKLILETFDNKSSQIKRVAGSKLTNKDVDGIWLSKEYAQLHKIEPNQVVTINYGGYHCNLKVVGIIQAADKIYFTGSQEYIAPNYSDYGYAYISQKTLKKRFPFVTAANYLEITGHNKKIRGKLERILGTKLLAYYSRKTLPEVANALERVGQIRNLSYLFSFIFILLAVLAMYTTIRRLIDGQITEMAILKALGFKRSEITRHYASFGLLVGGLGAITGLLVAPLISLFVLRTQKMMFSLPKWQLAYSYSALVLVMLVIVICLGAAFLAATQITKGLPAEFLRAEKQGKVHKLFLERNKLLWSKIPYGFRWALRDALANRMRILMGIVGVAGGMMLMIAGIGMPQSINHLVNKAYGQDFSYNKRLYPKNNLEYYAKHKNAKGQWVEITQAHFKNDDGYNRLLIVISNGDYVNMRTEANKKIAADGIYLTKGFANRAGYRVGESLSVKSAGKKYTFTIQGIIASETNQGAYLRKEAFERAGGTFTPTTLLVGKNTSRHGAEVGDVITMASQKYVAKKFVNNLQSIFYLIIFFAVLLISVVLYNLGSLSFIERLRDYATLRVLGIHKKELRNLTLIENVVTTMIGWALGIPLGYWFLGQYVATFSTINLEYTPYVNLLTIILASVFVWLCSLSTTLLLSRRIRKIDMVQALKGVE
ncbi:FtsX-like permease family protein [Ligilactobacillus agilis]|uniref:FtsX-like permease family protein n=1 Tax=Ligilactobacillus agilis TaxID=1601 RepID=UPI00195D4A58|nr:FtsX-like permease family protein [Ligilactobacillus agilis]